MREMSAIFASTPPSFPVRATVFIPISLATSKALMILEEFPLVLMPMATSPSLPRALSCLAKISLKAMSLETLVIMEVSVVRAMAGSGGRSMIYRLTNSAARCWASAALPPFPKKKSLFPDTKVREISLITSRSLGRFSLRKRALTSALSLNRFRMIFSIASKYYTPLASLSRIPFEISEKVQKSLITSIRDRLHRYEMH